MTSKTTDSNTIQTTLVDTASASEIEKGSADSAKAAVLRRISTEKQDSGAGLDAQDKTIERRKEEVKEDVEVVIDFELKGVSGTEFPRPDLYELLRSAWEGEIDLLFVKDISRIGRVAPLLASFIWVLNTQCGIDIVTEHGRYNVCRQDDLIQIMWRATSTENKNRYRASYVHESQISAFEDGELHVTNWKPMYGYDRVTEEEGKESDGSDQDSGLEKQSDSTDSDPIQEGEDLEVNEDEAEVVQVLFTLACEVGPQQDIFARVYERVSEEFAEDRLPEKGTVSSILRHSIYVGVAEWKIDSEYDEEPRRATHERDDWQIISEEIFNEVQDILDERDVKYGYGNDVSDGEEETTPDLSLRDFARIVGWERLATFDDVVRVHCPNCGEEMSDNGHWQATSNIYPSDMDDVPEDPLIKRYKCKNEECLREKRFPNEFEAYRIFDKDISLSELVEQT